MSSIRWNDIVFGPIHSRRLGTSLGINLLPTNGKICTFDCIYCECGWNKDGGKGGGMPTKEDVFRVMEERLKTLRDEKVSIDSITFSGNGEPTIHPDFADIIDYTIQMRDIYYPNALVSVLSNATQIDKPKVKSALMKVDNPILKIDSALESYVRLIDRPQGNYSLNQIINHLLSFNGDFILQTMFLKGNVDGNEIDCTNSKLTSEWIKMVLKLHPREVMIYTIDRDTPLKGLEKVTVEEMEVIAAPLFEKGINVQIRG